MRPSSHLQKVSTRNKKVSPRTLHTALVFSEIQGAEKVFLRSVTRRTKLDNIKNEIYKEAKY
jgi:hypothetical protein